MLSFPLILGDENRSLVASTITDAREHSFVPQFLPNIEAKGEEYPRQSH
jgi:hypothetical protein